MQAAESWLGHDSSATRRVNGSGYWHSARKSLMRAVILVVIEVLAEDSMQMFLVEHDHMIETFAADRAN